MKKPLWRFIDNQGTFLSETAQQINTLYFPLCNSSPMMASITPTLHGDLKTDNDSFLLEPVSRIDLSNSKSSRNFWIYINPKKIWSATGESKDTANDKFKLEAGLLYQKITRQNNRLGLKAEITSFIPASAEPVEIIRVDLTNISKKAVKFTATAAIPIYARSANNLRDHRHVTSLLNRIELNKFGVVVKPTLLFNESRHKKNITSYFVFGLGKKGEAPEYIYPTQEEFTGENSDLEAPNTVFNNLRPEKTKNIQGKDAMGALRFKTKTLRPKETYTYIILMGIVKDKKEIKNIFHKFNAPAKVERSLNANKKFWQNKSAEISLNSPDKTFDHWLAWVSIQPTLRKIFGCSFLPDFDYGRGGRGWRDLWQDCLWLILAHPEEVRPILINNFSGVRIDGSNATIIGQKAGEFIADRNNISRVWMDHGVWPLLTTLLYIHQTGDLKILLEKTDYFNDRHPQKIKGTILEHILIENLAQFYNVGPHRHIRLEDADWNDGLDMAKEFGESVAFSCMYAQNLKNICGLLEKLNLKNLSLLKELKILIAADTGPRRKVLDNYLKAVKSSTGNRKISVPIKELISDLNQKADWVIRHIQKKEWLGEGFYNGYYDNAKKRVEGKVGGRIQMTLTGQVFPMMSGVASKEQIAIIFKNAKKYLWDVKLGGLHLNTDFKEEQLNLGRAFSFVYGDKENGACFNHMSVMFASALYSRGFGKEGWEVMESIYKMALDTQKSKIYPCLPEYFNGEGRGMYSYLTGSASWFMLTLLTQVFGIRGEYGSLVIEPKLTTEQFALNKKISINTSFAGRRVEVRFINPHKKDFGKYALKKVSFNGEALTSYSNQPRLCILRQDFLAKSNKYTNLIEITLD